jgi:PAS domain S-box-containing protein
VDIRKKTILILSVSICCLILVLLVLAEVVVLDGFSRVENQNAQKDTNRVLTALGNDINTLDAMAHDWASRDDTRTFLLTTSSATSWSRLDADTFERLQVNYILLTDINGTLLSGKGYNFENDTEKPVPPALTALLSSHQPIFSWIQSESGTMGVLQLPEGPLMLAIRPVFSDPDNGQLAGYIMMGRYLDSMEVSRLSSMTQLPLELQPYRKADLPPDFRQAVVQFPQSSTPFIQREGKEALTIDAPTYILPLDNDKLGTYSLIRDMSGQSILILKVSIVRDIYDQGISSTVYFVILLIIAGLVFGLVILLLLEKTVLARILLLSRRLNEIGKKRDFTARVETSGEDEIGSLADNVNGMLGELETSQEQLQGRLIQSEEKYRLFFNSITDPVIIYRPGGEQDTGTSIIEANDAAAGLLGYSREELLSMSPDGIIIGKGPEEKPELLRFDGTERFVQYESFYRTKSGKMIPVEINARIFDEFGQKAVLTIARDITDRKMAEKVLMQANKKLNLLNFVTFNDIQNALMAIRGYIGLQKSVSTDVKMGGYLEKEDALLKRVSHSLDFAKNYQDLGIKTPQWHNVNETFIYAISHLDFSRINRRIDLDDLEIFSDPLLERVFLALADNLLTHAKTATEVTISYQETSDKLLLIFQDNGVGIPDSLKEQIFQRDFSAQKGMGLFLAREILDITGITIREAGTYGNGARFEITVPGGSFRFMGKKA